MPFPGQNYAPPGVFTTTLFENPLASALESLKIPIIIGEGNENLIQQDLEIVRGSSSTVDQRVVGEDESLRAVVVESATGQITLGAWDGVLDKLQVVNYPIVTGDGTGTTTTSRTDVTVTINNEVIAVRSVAGSTGLVQLATVPSPGDVVRCTYYFDRTDTLLTDDVSEQVPNRLATVKALSGLADVDAPNSTSAVLDIHGDITVGGVVVDAANNVVNLVVDSVARSIALPARSTYTMAQIAAAITAARAGTLTATTFVNSYGHSTLSLLATYSVSVADGSANGLLGLIAGLADNRVSTFYTFQGPIVDGSGGGVTTTDPSHVVVRVDGVQVIPSSVDGASRAVTLSRAPKAGAVMSIQYYWNTWQDTFDYLAHIAVTSVTQCGSVPGVSDYTQGADFILEDDRIMWGTAATVIAGINTVGSEPFDDTQIGLSLVDNRTFLGACTPVVSAAGGVSTDSRLSFQLPVSPTLGNGRDTPLGQSLYQTISNNRIDVATNRPDVVWAYWGYDVQDAMARGKVEVLKVEGSVLTLAEAVPPGASVWATVYYNVLTDATYTIANEAAGASGVGQYAVKNALGASIFGASITAGSKGAALVGVTVEFPSGSELNPDFHYESVSGDFFTGPVDEIVTVQFAARKASPAKYGLSGAGPYAFIDGQSDHLRVQVHGIEATSTAGLDLASPSAVLTHTGGFFASLVGTELAYEGGVGSVEGESVTITADETLTLIVDDVSIPVVLPPATAVDATYFADRINEHASGHGGLAQGGSIASTLVLSATATPPAAATSDDYYNGWVIVVGNGGAGTAGQAVTVTDYDGVTQTATVTPVWAAASPIVTDPYFIYNPNTVALYTGATKFDGPVTLAVGLHDKMRMVYTGDVSGALVFTAGNTVDLGDGPFATAALLAAEVTSQTAVQVTALASVAHAGLIITCAANADGQLQFSMQLPGVDTAGSLQFLDAATAAEDFAILAGLDTGAAAAGGQAALVQGPIARAYECPVTGEYKPYDRIILRNRFLPGGGGSMAADFVVSQTELGVQVGNDIVGLATGDTGYAGSAAVVHPATMYGNVGIIGGQDAVTAEPAVLFYDGTGTQGANDDFLFELDGTPVEVNFTATPTGTSTALGPITAVASVLGQIVAAMAAVPGAPWGNAAAVIAAGLVIQEGAGTRLKGVLTNEQAKIVIGSGNANGSIGFGSGAAAFRSLVETKKLASALMSHQIATFNDWTLDPTAVPGGGTHTFVRYGFATVVLDETDAEFLYIQDAPALTASLGSASSVTVRDPSPNVQSALFYGTGLTSEDGDGAVGDPALDGYFVISSNSAGSGSVATSVLNNGTGQDGVVGQTYIDDVTGLTFTILPRNWSTDKVGPWISYPTGATAIFRVACSTTFTCDANIPVRVIPGVEMKVANTVNVAVDDTATVKTYERAGNEPSIGDLYYASYIYTKQDFTTQFYTKMSSVEAAYGSPIPDNPVSLATYLAMLNGAVLVGVKQVQKEGTGEQASVASYTAAIAEMEGVLPGFVTPDIITPMRGDSTDMYQILRRSCDKMSSIRYKSERTAIVGTVSGTLPTDAISLAQTLGSTRMRLVYPDMATLTVQDNLNNVREYLVDGPFLAAALAGSVVSPNLDVATPWTGRRLTGFTQLARLLDPVEANQVAQKGVTILEDKPPFLRVRHGLTTDMSNILTKLPTIIMIADEVQRQARNVLENFVGIKFLPGVVSQIEGRLAMMLKRLVAAQIISAYTGVKANISADDPTIAEIEAYYSPVFPLLYLILTFHLRSSL